MLEHRRWESLDRADFGWLRARHHFQVNGGGHAAHRALGSLLIWNDDEIGVGGGFPMHRHRDMEIITYVRQGVLGHRDTLGSEGTIHAGGVQVMSAGTGIRHAEFNKGDVPLRLYQIWLLPREPGGEPRWDARPFPKSGPTGRFAVLASGFAEDQEALPIRGDARVLGAMLKAGEPIRQLLEPFRHAYLVVASGRIEVSGELMGTFDGAAITNSEAIEVCALEDAEVLLVETDSEPEHTADSIPPEKI
jgi:hypothetical protein